MDDEERVGMAGGSSGNGRNGGNGGSGGKSCCRAMVVPGGVREIWLMIAASGDSEVRVSGLSPPQWIKLFRVDKAVQKIRRYQ